MYSDWLSIPLPIARRTRDEFFPKDNQATDVIAESDLAMQDAVTYKFLSTPLTRSQLDDLIKIQK
jgi:NitT/TauT family transport system substrate-binding protein